MNEFNSITRETTMAYLKFHSFAGVGALVLCLTCASPVAHADLNINSSVGGSPTNVGSIFQNFDSLTPGTNGGTPVVVGNDGAVLGPIGNTVTVNFNPTSGTPIGVALGSNPGNNAAPFLSGGNGAGFGNGDGADTTPYLATGTGTVTLTFSSNQMYFGLLWGSVDSYNTLTFFNSINQNVGSITGQSVLNMPTGDQGENGTVYVNINSTESFDRVELTSSANAFEFDNIAYNEANVASVPEPSTFVIAAFGALAMIGYGLRRKGLRFISR
jgi:hypothetical protein